MTNETFTRINEQFETIVLTPVRSVIAAATDLAETNTDIQLKAARAYTDVTLRNARAALDIRDAEGLKTYLSNQPTVAREFSERVKSDVSALTAGNQAFAEIAQTVTEESLASAQKAAEDGLERVRKGAADVAG